MHKSIIILPKNRFHLLFANSLLLTWGLIYPGADYKFFEKEKYIILTINTKNPLPSVKRLYDTLKQQYKNGQSKYGGQNYAE